MSVPVILDTDIGFDVDDVWALAFLLGCPELDLKLVLTNTGPQRYGAAVAARLLHAGNRSDVPIGLGVPLLNTEQTHAKWLADYSLKDYPGDVHEAGVAQMCRIIRESPEPVTIIGIGPLGNLAAALNQCPDIVGNARFIGMHGSLRVGYLGAPKPMREYNVKALPLAAQTVLQAPWDVAIAPLDSCGNVILRGAPFARLQQSKATLLQEVLAAHFAWFEAVADWPVIREMKPTEQSSVLYDTVPVYMAFAEDLLKMETLPVTVTDDGKTRIDESGKTMRCATGWNNYEAFLDLVTDRLISA